MNELDVIAQIEKLIEIIESNNWQHIIYNQLNMPITSMVVRMQREAAIAAETLNEQKETIIKLNKQIEVSKNLYTALSLFITAFSK